MLKAYSSTIKILKNLKLEFFYRVQEKVQA